MNLLRFAKRIPVYLNRERDYQEHARGGLRHEVICYDEATRFRCPNDALVFSQFQAHVFQPQSREEIRQFLHLAEGCRRSIDAGASAGIFSMLFAVSRPGASILSVEPEDRSFRLLCEARALNLREGVDWSTARCVLAASPGRVMIDTSELGATVAGVDRGATRGAGQEAAEAHSLASLCSAHGFLPDLLKLDIESFEYEVLTSSRDFLAETMPRIQLELHNFLIRRRSLDPAAPLRVLFDLGYSDQVLGRSWQAWCRAVDASVQHRHQTRHFFLSKSSG